MASLGVDAACAGASVPSSSATARSVGDVECHPDFQPGGETAERFDPATDRWTEAESLNKPRNGNDMVRTGDGEAMVVGGLNADGDPFSSTKLFDPTTGRWRDGPLLDRGRADPVAGGTPDGHIVVASSEYTGETSQTSTVEVLAPGSDAWQAGAPLEGMGIERFVPLIGGGIVAMGAAFESPNWLLLDRSGTGQAWEEIEPSGFLSITHLIALPDGGFLATGTLPSEFGESATSVPRRFDPTWHVARDRADVDGTEFRSGHDPGRWSCSPAGSGSMGTSTSGSNRPPRSTTRSRIAGRRDLPLRGPRNHGFSPTLEDDSVLVMGGYASEETDPQALPGSAHHGRAVVSMTSSPLECSARSSPGLSLLVGTTAPPSTAEQVDMSSPASPRVIRSGPRRRRAWSKQSRAARECSTGRIQPRPDGDARRRLGGHARSMDGRRADASRAAGLSALSSATAPSLPSGRLRVSTGRCSLGQRGGRGVRPECRHVDGDRVPQQAAEVVRHARDAGWRRARPRGHQSG